MDNREIEECLVISENKIRAFNQELARYIRQGWQPVVPVAMGVVSQYTTVFSATLVKYKETNDEL